MKAKPQSPAEPKSTSMPQAQTSAKALERPVQHSTSVMRVFDFMSTDLVTTGSADHLDDAIHRMLDRDVGCIIVTEDHRGVVGIVTKGDILRKVLLKGLDPHKVTAKSAMSSPVVTVDHEATIEAASRIMTTRNVSKLPVIKNGNLVGIITSTDIIRAEPMQVGYLQELVVARFVPHELRTP